MILLNEQALLKLEEIRKDIETTDIGVVSTTQLREIVINILRDDVDLAYVHSGLLYKNRQIIGTKESSTPDDPAIIMESGACPCSIVIAYDDLGNCKIIHIAHYTKFMGNLDQTTNQQNDLALAELKSFIDKTPACRLLLTSTNIAPNLREEVFLDIVMQLKIDEAVVTRVFLDSKPIAGQKFPSLGITEDLIHTVVFIPKNFTKDKRNKLYIIGDTEEDLRDEANAIWLVRDAFQN